MIPPPTLCPDCRLQRRMAQRSERTLFKRPCDQSGRMILSMYPRSVPFPVFERSIWLGDSWDALSYGRQFSFTQPFFRQFGDLYNQVPRPALSGKNTDNCDFCNHCFDSRNCYLTQCCYYSESLLYCYWPLHSRDCVDCSYIFQCEQCYQCADCNHSYDCRYCTLCHSCNDCHSSYDCRNCSSCFSCVGLRGKKYCFLNEQLEKDEYDERMKAFDEMDMKAILEKVEVLRLKHPHKHSVQEKSEHCSGDYVFESKDCSEAFQAFRSRDCHYLQDADDMKDCLDSYHCGWSELQYETYSPVRLHTAGFIMLCWDGENLWYSDSCQSCSHCFGCVGLKHRKYCILNKQYTKEEYETLVRKIVDHMYKTGEWGEFFPVQQSPFAYNETVAHEYYPLTKKEVQNRGWNWRDQTDDIPSVERIIPATQLPVSIKDIPDDILTWAIQCEESNRPFKIIRQELDFYRRHNVPVPHLHPDVRHRQRMALRNPRKLWNRKCAKCAKEIETSYAPTRPEIVYCEECYLKEVY